MEVQQVRESSRQILLNIFEQIEHLEGVLVQLPIRNYLGSILEPLKHLTLAS